MPKRKKRAEDPEDTLPLPHRDEETAEDANTETALKLASLCDILEQVLTITKSIDGVSSSSLPAVRRARTLAMTIVDAFPVDPTIERIKFEHHKASLSSQLATLQKSCKTDWHDGYDEQWEYMEKMGEEIGKWLPDIWSVLEAGADFQLARACLAYCTEVVKDIWHCESRAEFSDQDVKISIQNAGGQTVYKARRHIDAALNWFWRELLINDALTKHDPLSSLIMADLEKYDLTETVLKLIDGGDGKSSGREPLHNGHWTQEMHTTARALVETRQQNRIAEFLKNPSLGLYNALVTDALKPSFIDAVRKDIASKHTKISYPAAIEIFSQNGLLDDIVPLIKHVREDQTLRMIAKIFSTSAQHRAMGRKLLKEGLVRGNTDIIDEIELVFPGLEDASDYLDEHVYDKYDRALLQQKPTNPNSDLAKTLDDIADKFVDIASNQNDYEYSRRLDLPEPEDFPDFSRNIFNWLEVLGEWPDRRDAAAIWEEVRWESDDDPFGVHGIMSFMAYACEDNRFSLAQGIRTAEKVYACKNLQELAKYIPKTQASGRFRITSVPVIY